MTLSDLFSSAGNLTTPRILVVGDVMLDCITKCEVLGISPEDELAWKVRECSDDWMLGGAANVALNLKALGADVFLFGIIGDDDISEVAVAMAASSGIKSRLYIEESRCTTVKRRLVTAHGRHILRVDKENIAAMSDSGLCYLRKVLEFDGSENSRFDAIVVSDYGKGVVTSELMEAISSQKCPVLVDPKGRDFLKYGKVYVITPNKDEMNVAVGSEDPCYKLDADCSWVVVKKSERGSTLYRNGRSHKHWLAVQDFKVRARLRGDPTGCGDSFISALAYATALSWPIETSVSLASAAGACAFDFTGVHAVTRGELLGELEKFQYGEIYDGC